MKRLRFFPDTSPSRSLAYYVLAQIAYSGLAGAFEMPMALRLAGKLELVAAVYAFYYTTLLLGFTLGSTALAGGKASSIFRLQLSLQAGLCLLAAALFHRLTGMLPLVLYFSVRGTAEGLFWSARHRSMIRVVKDAGRDDFALRVQSIAVAVGIAAPLLSGAAVSYLGSLARAGNPSLPGGYASVFLATGLVLLLVLLFSPRLEIGRVPLSLDRIVAVGRLAEGRDWRTYISVIAFAGVAASVSSGILTFGILKTEFGVGAINAAMALMSGVWFSGLRRWLAARPSARTRNRLLGALLGCSSDAVSRLGYALAPVPGVLAAKAALDSFAVPLRNLFGENLLRAELERISAATEASIAELYLYQEARIWVARMAVCAIIGLLVPLGVATLGPEGSRLAIRGVIALAAPLSIVEYRFLRRFASRAS